MNDLVTWMIQDYATKRKIWTFRHKGRLSGGSDGHSAKERSGVRVS